MMRRSPKTWSDPVYTPEPPSERGQWAFVATICLVSVAVMVAVAFGAFNGSRTAARASYVVRLQAAAAESRPPTLPAVVRPVAARRHTPGRRPRDATLARRGQRERRRPTRFLQARIASTTRPSPAEQSPSRPRTERSAAQSRSSPWIEAFYPIYATAQSTFDVNWLLIASIHEQETAFSTDPTTYHGLNFAGCCAGPMQFNVTNGPVSTWDIARNAYRQGRRPALYDHRTSTHPSIYDDYDSIMAAAWLLGSDGAGLGLSGPAWRAAYDYYGHDSAGIEYANVVIARAIGWSQHGFCPGCSVEPLLVQAVQEAYGEHP
jgi:hypothetical protein